MILLLIDIQNSFHTARKGSVIQACRREVNRARNMGWNIIAVTYRDPTIVDDSVIPRVRKALEGYDKFVHVFKDKDDGSSVVLEATEGMDRSVFRVCGVNAYACVAATVCPLVRALPESLFELVFDGCNCFHRPILSLSVIRAMDRNRVKLVNFVGYELL